MRRYRINYRINLDDFGDNRDLNNIVDRVIELLRRYGERPSRSGSEDLYSYTIMGKRLFKLDEIPDLIEMLRDDLELNSFPTLHSIDVEIYGKDEGEDYRVAIYTVLYNLPGVVEEISNVDIELEQELEDITTWNYNRY